MPHGRSLNPLTASTLVSPWMCLALLGVAFLGILCFLCFGFNFIFLSVIHTQMSNSQMVLGSLLVCVHAHPNTLFFFKKNLTSSLFFCMTIEFHIQNLVEL